MLGVLLSAQAIVYAIVIGRYHGTGDSGDSVMHYLYAKYAFQHRELFFNHWAKPLFVLLASPFAQFGFNGIKVFNACLMLLCTFFTYKTIEKIGIQNALIGVIILIFSPLTFVLTFSGLTEPLFATMLIISIYQFVSNRILIGCIMASFLPFVRSEGLIILCVIVVFLFLRREAKRIPWLLVGSIIYSAAGAAVHQNLLWVFTEIPYAQLSSTYNSLYTNEGRLFHFITQMNYVVGVPIYVLFWTGILSFVTQFKKSLFNYNLSILVFGAFAAFFVAHTLFLFFGIFNSMGLKRVLIGVAPLSAIMALVGFNRILELFGEASLTRKFVKSAIVCILLLFPFTSNPAAMHPEKNLHLATDQKLSQEIAYLLREQGKNERRLFFQHPYLSICLDVDWFDSSKRMNLTEGGLEEIRSGDIVIWDNWFAVVEGGSNAESFSKQTSFKHLGTFTAYDNREITFSVFEYQ